MNEVPASPTLPAATSPADSLVPAEATRRARDAASAWQALTLKQRLAVLAAFRDRLLDGLEPFVDAVVAESGKPRLDVVNEVFQSCALLRTLAKKAPGWLKREKVGSGLLIHKRGWIEYRPLGVVAVITPWNYPVVLVLSPVLQALVAGNAVVLKPSERATEAARRLHQLWTASNSHADAWVLLEGGPDAARDLAGGDVDKVAFTGGPEGGRAIARAAAERLTPVLLELGGSDPMLVLADADLERAADAAVWGAFYNNGQSCISVSRCFVEEEVAQPFLDRVLAKARTLRGGRPVADDEDDRDYGPLRTDGQRVRLRRLVDDAVAKGATVLLGGDGPAADPLLFPPTVLDHVRPGMDVLREESFGPLLPVVRIASAEEAVRLANDCPLGLAASVWTRDRAKGRLLARRLQAGGVVINDVMLHFAITELPFGGVKGSGYGRTHGRHGLHEFCAVTAVAEHAYGPRREIHWFPSAGKAAWMARLMRWLFRRGFAKFRSGERGA